MIFSSLIVLDSIQKAQTNSDRKRKSLSYDILALNNKILDLHELQSAMHDKIINHILQNKLMKPKSKNNNNSKKNNHNNKNSNIDITMLRISDMQPCNTTLLNDGSLLFGKVIAYFSELLNFLETNQSKYDKWIETMKKQCKEAKLIVEKFEELKQRADKAKNKRKKNAKNKQESRKKQSMANEDNNEENLENIAAIAMTTIITKSNKCDGQLTLMYFFCCINRFG